MHVWKLKMAIVLGMVAFAVLFICSSVLEGYVFSVLWGWFIVPTFNAPQLSVVSVIGIAMMLSFITYQYNKDKSEESVHRGFIRLILRSISLSIIILLFGWILHLFM